MNNFVTLARWGYYDGTTLFRTDPSIDIIQGGSPHTESASDQGPGYSIADEPTFELDENNQLIGTYTYGTETTRDGRTATSFELAMDLAGKVPFDKLVSATYPLDRYRDALAHAANAGPRGGVKIAFDLRDEKRRGLPEE